ncbi:MAG: hypothetical protein ACK6AT_01205, partial [Planctomycetota bacterium]
STATGSFDLLSEYRIGGRSKLSCANSGKLDGKKANAIDKDEAIQNLTLCAMMCAPQNEFAGGEPFGDAFILSYAWSKDPIEPDKLVDPAVRRIEAG